MNSLLQKTFRIAFLAASAASFTACDDDESGPSLTGDNKTFTLSEKSASGVNGNVTFAKRSDNSTLITIQLTGTSSGGDHPAHIHTNSAAEGGNIILDLENVNGGTGKSETVVTTLNDGTAISYEELIAIDGYVNVHASSSDLATLIAQGDVGENELTGDTTVYTLNSVSNQAISGTATFARRENDETLITLDLDGTTAGGSHPAHIHMNSAAKGGGIVIDLNAVDGATGMSQTNIIEQNDGTAINYDDLLDFNGYINVHLSSTNLGTLIAQGDIGQNELTGEKETYTLNPVSDANISGTATFEERLNGQTLVTVSLTGTTAGVISPSHIHANSAAQGGGIMIDLTSVDGTTGKAISNVSQLNSGTAITYDELINYNGYLNVHLNASNPGTLIAQGDIGQNELTGTSKVYTLNVVSDPGISGTATFAQRKSGYTLITISLLGTSAGGDHPAHIHANNAATGGGIVLDLKNVNGTTGKSATNVTKLNDNTAITYTQLVAYNGHLNVHLSTTNLSTLIAQGNIGSNAP